MDPFSPVSPLSGDEQAGIESRLEASRRRSAAPGRTTLITDARDEAKRRGYGAYRVLSLDGVARWVVNRGRVSRGRLRIGAPRRRIASVVHSRLDVSLTTQCPRQGPVQSLSVCPSGRDSTDSQPDGKRVEGSD